MAFLTVDHLKLHYQTDRGAVRAVDDLSIEVEESGTALGIIGETGSGKSSFAMSVARILAPNVSTYEGKIVLSGSDLMALTNDEFRLAVRWRKVAVVFQGSMNGFNPVMRVGRQIAEPLVTIGEETKQAALAKARDLLVSVGLPAAIADRYPHELSGGMKQRVAIAMGLAMDPELLILDEPTSALDVSVQAQIMNLLKKLKWDTGISMIFVTHDIALASEISDMIAVMYAGQIREYGEADRILTEPKDPYTTELLASMPSLHSTKMPGFVAGSAPDPISPPGGCRFYERCSVSFARCESESPAIYQVSESQAARCFLLEGAT